MLIASFFILLGFALEFAVLSHLYFATWSIWQLLGTHLLATSAIMLAINHFRRSYRQYNSAIIGMLFMLMFFIPILGMFGSLMLAAWLYASQQRIQVPNVYYISLHRPSMPLRSSYGIGGVRLTLQDTRASVSKRITALNILSTIPTNLINNLVRTILPDKDYELRLLAFYLLNKQEMVLVPEISKAINLLEHEKSPEKQFYYQKLIALQFWELIYQSLVEPHLINFILDQSLRYANQALAYDNKNATLWFLVGRIYIRQKKFAEASVAFDHAIEAGIPAYQATPYLAESYFYQGQYKKIGALFKAQAVIPTSSISQGIIDFWSEANEQ